MGRRVVISVESQLSSPALARESDARNSIECGVLGSPSRLDSSLKFGHVLRYASLLEQVVARALLPTNRTAELRYKETGLQSFGESPTRGLAPFPGQPRIFLLHSSDITRDLDGDPLSCQCRRKIGPERLAIAIESEQRLQPRKRIQDIRPIVLSLQSISDPAAGD